MSKRPDEDPPVGAADPALMSLIDRLDALLERSELAELEVEAGETAIVLRKPAALAPLDGAVAAAVAGGPHTPGQPAADPAGAAEVLAMHAVLAPLTGIFYASPTPDSPAYVGVGDEIVAGQVIGLIEAMKLFNEIKSDVAGRVVRLVAESGRLVKAKQPLLEVEPL